MSSTPAPESAATGASAASFTRERARALALEAGFSLAELVPLPYAEENRDARRFEQWVGAGRAGTMHYLERVAENGRLLRARVGLPYPWARSALVCFALYNAARPLSTDPAPEGAAWIARYAWSSRSDADGNRRPSDYHKVLLRRLKALDARLRDEFGSFDSRAYVDTGPVVERSLAVAAGLGWTGKNTCLIHPQLGSFGFLAVLLTSLEVSEPAERQGSGVRDQGSKRQGARQQDSESASQLAGESATEAHELPLPASVGTAESPTGLVSGRGFSRADHATKDKRALAPEGSPLLIPDRCGSCTRCIEACPTHALDVPYQMDATRCIAYLTIEHKGPIDEELAAGVGRQVFGCDICQDVCPWNQKALRNGFVAMDPELEPRAELVNPALEWLAAMDEAEYEKQFNGSPVRRAGFLGLRRNVAIAMGNSGLERFRGRLEEWTSAADAGLRAAARWALGKLERTAPLPKS